VSRSDHARRALILVFNTASEDSRILREAGTLKDLGLETSIVGVVSADEQVTEARVNGFRVIRLTPVESLRRFLRRPELRARAAPGGRSAPDAPRAPTIGQRFVALRRLAVMSVYYLQGAALVRRMSPTIVHANDYNTMWIGIAAKLLRGSRLVYDMHELWPDQGLPEWRPWLLGCEWLFVRFADATVAANPAIAATIAERYRVPPPIVVRNVPERPAQQPVEVEGLRAGEPPVAVHVGTLGPNRGIEQLIEALALIPELRLRLMGRGSDEYRAHLEHLATEAEVAGRIEFRPPVEPAAVAEVIAGADIGILLTQPTCLNNIRSLPNKLFEYAAAGLPIVASDLPEITAIVRDEGIGEVVPPSDVEAIARAMQRLADPDRNAERRQRVREFAQRVNWQTERPVLEQVYARLLSTSLDG
jgi:glycosyltransferase involved in cell wall biosynthesis